MPPETTTLTRRRPERSGSGIVASMTVPPPSRSPTASAPSRTARRSRSPVRPLPVSPPRRSVVGDGHDSAPSRTTAPPRRAWRPSTWRRWSAPRRRRSRRSPRPRVPSALRRRRRDRDLHPVRERLDAGRQPAARSAAGRMPCASSRSSVTARSACDRAPRRPARDPARRRHAPAHGALSLSRMTVCTSRCCAPSWRSRTTRLRSSSAAASTRARDASTSSRRGLDLTRRSSPSSPSRSSASSGRWRARSAIERGDDLGDEQHPDRGEVLRLDAVSPAGLVWKIHSASALATDVTSPSRRPQVTVRAQHAEHVQHAAGDARVELLERIQTAVTARRRSRPRAQPAQGESRARYGQPPPVVQVGEDGEHAAVLGGVRA